MVGIPAPNPSYEIPIKNVTGQANVKIQNKNLLSIADGNALTTKFFDITDFVEVGKTYSFSAYLDLKNSTSLAQARLRIDKYIGTEVSYLGGNLIASQSEGISKRENVTLENTVTRVLLTIQSYGVADFNCDYSQIIGEQGSTATSYVPHQEQNLPLTLGDIELCKMNTSQDYFYKENGKWYLTKNIVKRNLKDIDYTRNVLSSGNIAFSRNVIYYGDYRNINALSSHLKGISDNQGNVLNSIRINSGNNLYIIVADNEISSSTDTFKNWCNTNNVVAYFKFKSPVITEITDTTLINQLEAILQARSYDDQTNISSTSDELGFIMDVESLRKKEN